MKLAQAMLGQVLVTKQTGPDGRLVSTILVASAETIKKEFYLAILLDRANSRPLIMASTEGGVDIEEVAEKSPEKILKEWIDPAVGIQPFQARKIAAGHKLAVVKSQIHAGGRGKGVFKDGFKGGVKLAKSAEEATAHAKAMLGNTLVTKQTGPDGRVVSTVLVAAAEDIKKEFYLAVLLDRANSRPLIMASTEGGVDIEEVAEKTPEKIIKQHIDPALGFQPWQGRKIAAALGLKGDLASAGAPERA